VSKSREMRQVKDGGKGSDKRVFDKTANDNYRKSKLWDNCKESKEKVK
jgi:hypothetical protein